MLHAISKSPYSLIAPTHHTEDSDIDLPQTVHLAIPYTEAMQIIELAAVIARTGADFIAQSEQESEWFLLPPQAVARESDVNDIDLEHVCRMANRKIKVFKDAFLLSATVKHTTIELESSLCQIDTLREYFEITDL